MVVRGCRRLRKLGLRRDGVGGLGGGEGLGLRVGEVE